MRQRVRTGAPWEIKYGYCRAVRVNNTVFVSGTVSINDDGAPHAIGDAGAQTTRALEIICKALIALGAQPSDIVRTRIYVPEINDEKQSAIGNAHGAMFKDNPPATSMIGVQALVDPVFLVEIEAEAVILDQVSREQ